MIFVSVALAVALALGGSMSVMAHDAEPGDALYSYKVHVNENVRAGVDATAESFSDIRASISDTLNFESDVDANAEADAEAQVNGDAEVEGNDRDAEDGNESNVNVDGSVKTDVDAGFRIGL